VTETVQQVKSKLKGYVFLASIAVAAIFAGCSSAVQTTHTSNEPPAIDTDRVRIDQIVHWMERSSVAARALYAEGSMTVANDVTSQNASFTLASKRLSAESSLHNSNREDSLSILISGPFGISVARLLASPQQYYFYNNLTGESFHGATDAHSLESLTQMKNVSLDLMSDALYGLAPGLEDLNPQDSLVLLSSGETQHTLVVLRELMNETDALDLSGSIPEGAEPIPSTGLALTRVRRYRGLIDASRLAAIQPDIRLNYSNHTLNNGVQLPQTIEVHTGHDELSLEYKTIDANRDDRVVKIKMPN